MYREIPGSEDFESAAGSKTQRMNKIHGKLAHRNFLPLRDSLMNYFKRGGFFFFWFGSLWLNFISEWRNTKAN